MPVTVFIQNCARKAWRAWATAVGASLLVIGCGDDDETSKPVPPPGPPQLRIEALHPAGHGVLSRDEFDCVQLGADENGTIVLQLGPTESNGVELVNWTFRPFDGCGNTPQCGLVAVRVTPSGATDPALVTAGASAMVSLPFGDDALGTGTFTIEAELVDDHGRAFVLDGGLFQDAVEVTVSDRCIPAPEAGVGPTDAAGPPRDGASDAAGTKDAGAEASPLPDVSAPDAGATDAGSPDASVLDASVDGAAADASDAGGAQDASSDAPTGG